MGFIRGIISFDFKLFMSALRPFFKASYVDYFLLVFFAAGFFAFGAALAVFAAVLAGALTVFTAFFAGAFFSFEGAKLTSETEIA